MSTTTTHDTAQDTYLDSGAATTARGADTSMKVGFDSGTGDIYRGLLDFSVAAIDSSPVVTGALLLTCYATTHGGGAIAVGVHRVTQAWTEATCTWNKYGAGDWATAGGDFVATAATTVLLPTAGAPWVITSLEDLVDDARDNRSNLFSILLKRVTEAGADGYASVYSAEQSGGRYMPTLIVTTQQFTYYLPAIGTAEAAMPARQDIELAQHAGAPALTWTITDSTGAAIDLSADTIRLVVYSGVPGDETVDFYKETGGSGIVVGGTSDNEVTVTIDPTDVPDVVHERYSLWRMEGGTTDTLLAHGAFSVVQSQKATT